MKQLFMLFVVMSMSACQPGCPGYLYIQEESGRGDFVKAEQNRKIKVLEAQAALDSAKLHAQSEIERAKGVAASNQIIGESLHENEGYLRWLWIQQLSDGEKHAPSIIYVPTEAGIPILEAGRMVKQ